MKESVVLPSWWCSLTPIHYGYEQCLHGQSYGPAVRSHYLIHYVLSGKGSYSVNGQQYELSAGDLFVIRPGEVTVYAADAHEPWAYSWIGFSVDEQMGLLPEYTCRLPSAAVYFEHLRELNQTEGCDGDVYALLYQFMAELYRMYGSPSGGEADYATRARFMIETGYMHSVSIQELADSMHINRHYLCQLFRRKYGISPQAFLTRTRMDNAAEFLSLGYSVTEVSSMVGIQDVSDFSRMFKNHFGRSPSGHRGSKPASGVLPQTAD